MPTWSILIATLASRQGKLRQLLDALLPQAEQVLGVEVVGLHNRGERLIGEYRQALLLDARGEYVSFVDDDDMVEPDFVPAVTAAMSTLVEGKYPDYIAFQHLLYENGSRVGPPAFIGLEHGGWFDVFIGSPERPAGMYRDVTHINPVRTEIARKASFPDIGAYEDRAYVTGVRELARTQVSIPRALYHYRHSMADSTWVGTLPPQPCAPPLEVDSPVFRWHPWSPG